MPRTCSPARAERERGAFLEVGALPPLPPLPPLPETPLPPLPDCRGEGKARGKGRVGGWEEGGKGREGKLGCWGQLELESTWWRGVHGRPEGINVTPGR